MMAFYRFSLVCPKLPMIQRCLSSTASLSGSSSPAKPFSEIPTPKGKLPFLGHALEVQKAAASLSDYIGQQHKELGPIFKIQLPVGNNLVFVADPSAMEKVFRNEGKYPSRSQAMEDAFRYLAKYRNQDLGFGVDQGESWRVNRSKLGKQLAPANVYAYCPGFNRVADRMIRNIQQVQNKDGYVEDMQQLVILWSFEVGAYFALKADIDSINDDSHAKKMQDTLAAVIDAIAEYQVASPLYKIYSTPAFKRINKALDDISSLISNELAVHINEIKHNTEGKEKVHGMSLLEQWLIEGNMTEEEAIQNTIVMMSSGIDTTSNTTSFLLYELAKHPEVQDKLYEQVTSVLGDKEADGESLQKLPYLGQLIQEAMRYYSVTPYAVRALFNDINLLGYNIPARTTVLYDQKVVGFDPQYFNNPHEFNPDRWSTDDIHPFAQLPFSFGPRGCWGRRFAEIEMKTLLTKVSQSCNVYASERCDDDVNTKLPTSYVSVARPDAPIKIKMIPR